MVSLFTNLAAYSAQGNIATANDAATASVARLSSGQRIVKASDDVAGLSVGTVLATGVTTLKQALANTGQGTSLLQVADGALAQITNILSRQKAIATQGNSGTLSDIERSYLNQEFQSLTAQIDQIAGATTFSSVKLLDGTLSGAQDLKSNTNVSSVTVANQYTADQTGGSPITIANNANLTSGDTITINGVTVTLTSSPVGTAAAVGKVVIGATSTATTDNLVAFLNSSTDARLANFQFVDTSGAAGTIKAVYNGGALNGSMVLSVSASVATAGAITTGNNANRTISSGSANNVDGLTYAKTVALGTIKGSILATGTSAATGAGAAIQLNDATNSIINNADFVGKIGEGKISLITASLDLSAANKAVYQIKVGDITYTAASTASTAAAAPIALNFIGKDDTGASAGGSFTIYLSGTGFTFSSQDQLDGYVSQINQALSGISFVQNRDVSSFVAGGTAVVGGAIVGTLQGASFNLRSDNFSNVTLDDFQIEAPTNGSLDAKFTAVINGETYVSVAGQGNQIAVNTTLALQSVTNPARVLTLVTGNTALPTTGSTTALDLSVQSNADAVAQAIRQAFGLDGSKSAINLQVGARSTDTVGVQIRSVKSAILFQNQPLDITTITGAENASAAVDVALQTVSSTRATVGALQSRLGFTAQNLQNAISNQDAARSVLLDTDVSSESTKYATSQVQLQAGIAVLAQANQITQQLLKLLQ